MKYAEDLLIAGGYRALFQHRARAQMLSQMKMGSSSLLSCIISQGTEDNRLPFGHFSLL